jgi:hypothetical protein
MPSHHNVDQAMALIVHFHSEGLFPAEMISLTSETRETTMAWTRCLHASPPFLSTEAYNSDEENVPSPSTTVSGEVACVRTLVKRSATSP